MTVVDLGGRGSSAPRQAARPLKRKSLLYEDVIEMVERLVEERDLKPGDMLPTQAELAKLAGVSLITVRRALEELERIGIVRCRQGLGTFLARPRIVAAPARPGGLLGTMSNDDSPGGLVTSLLELELGTPSSDVAEALQIAPDAQVWKVRRCRFIDGRPLILETAIIPVALTPDLDGHRDEIGASLYELLANRYHLVDDYEEQLLEVVAPSTEERRLLRLAARSLVVRLRGRSLDQNGVVFDCFEQVYPAADFTFSISGPTSRQLVRGSGARDWTVSPIREPSPHRAKR